MDFYGLKIGGNRPVEVHELSGRYGCNVSILDESKNPSGTFKDRRNASVIKQDDHIEEPVFYVQISSGNSSRSMGMLCEHARRNGKERYSIALMGRDTPYAYLKALEPLHQYEGRTLLETVDLSGEIIHNHTLSDRGKKVLTDRGIPIEGKQFRFVEQIGANADGYGEMLDECLSVSPRYVFCPVGEGELMTKLILRNIEKGSPTRIVGVTVKNNVHSSQYNGKKTRRRSIADKLETSYSDFQDRIKGFKPEYGVLTASEKTILEEYQFLTKIQVPVEPSAATAFAGAYSFIPLNQKIARIVKPENRIQSSDNVVVINTGKGLFQEPNPSLGDTVLKQFARSALPVAVAGLMIFRYQMSENVQKNEEWSRKYIEQQRQELAERHPLSDIEAFARYKGSIQRLEDGRPALLQWAWPQQGNFVLVPNDRVRANLEAWYLYNDIATRAMYSAPGSTMRRDVEEFESFKKIRADAEAERKRRSEKWYDEVYKLKK